MNTATTYILSIVLGLVTLFTSTMGIFLPSSAIESAYSAFDDIDMYESQYYMDESYSYVANIPWDEYLLEESENDAEVYYIQDFGADVDNDGAENATAINNTIIEANANGGGIVYVSGGAYTTSTIYLLSNITLKIAEGSSLVSVTHDENKELASSNQLANALIKCSNAENVTIEGPGTIDGEGRTFMCDPVLEVPTMMVDYTVFNLKDYILTFRSSIAFSMIDTDRVNLIRFDNVDNVTITNVVFQESAYWTCRLLYCDNVEVSNLIINNNVHVENADGIDICSSNDVVVHDCFVVAADDGICVKSYSVSGCSNITVYDCEVMSMANCFKVGTPSNQPVTNIEVYDCKFFNCGLLGGYSGIVLESVDGMDLSDIYIHDIDMDAITSPLFICVGARLDYSAEEPGSISNVLIENITARDVDLPSAIVGCTSPDDITDIYYAYDITLRNFYVIYREGVTEDLQLPGILEAFLAQTSASSYPEITRVFYLGLGNFYDSIMCDFPVYGLYCRYAHDITIENFNVIPREDTVLSQDNVQDVFDRFFVYNVSWS